MADLRIHSLMKVKTLQANFKKCFGSSLRVYKSATCKGAMADPEATLGSLSDKKGGELTVGGNKTVGKFEKEFAETYGIGVQVANADNTALASDTVTLVAAGKK